MRDWLFYPLIGLLAAAIILTAFRAGGPREAINTAQGFVIEGTLLQTLTPSPGTSLAFKAEGTNPISYAVMGADFKANAQPSAGVFAVLGPEYSKAYAGKDLTLTIRARAGAKNPSKEFMIGFFPYTSGRIKWQNFEPTPEFSDYVLTTKLGPYNPAQPEIYFGIWPDTEGASHTIEVEKYEVRLAE